MDVIFEMADGQQFSIETWFFATVLEMKQNVQKYLGIPIPNQCLIFNGEVMLDDRDTEHYEVLQGSVIQLHVIEPEPEPQPEPEPVPTRVLVRIPVSKIEIHFEVEAAETVAELKEKIHKVQGFPTDRFALFLKGGELMDDWILAEHGVDGESEIDVVLMPFEAPRAAPGRKLRLNVVMKCKVKVEVEVKASENVGELRKELRRLREKLQFELPPDEGYYFLYKRNVMADNRSFSWHGVEQGDTIVVSTKSGRVAGW